MKIALASPPFPKDMQESLYWLEKQITEAACKEAKIICFPECFLPGMRCLDYTLPSYSLEELRAAREQVMKWAEKNHILVLLPMEWPCEQGLENQVFVISPEGLLMGSQPKCQLDPSEEGTYIPGNKRMLFEINGVPFGIAICHEGWRYPETTRWAAVRGAKIVFHPHACGSDISGRQLKSWGEKENPYYEKAMMCRALENNIYFASVNYSFRYQDSATSLISPDGECLTWQPYGEPGVLIYDIDINKATNQLADRFKPSLLKD